MKPVYTYAVRPCLPENLQFLSNLAYNLWWEWHYDAIDLFRRLSRKQWDESGGNPVYVLLRTEQKRIDYLSQEEGFLNHFDRIRSACEHYMSEPRWFQKTYPEHQDTSIAYFSAEYGISNCLPIYSGGLGILAGDHLKTASDMGLPLTAIGLAYRQGYFHQYLNIDGWQQERYDDNDFAEMPLQRVLDDQGKWLTIDVPYLGRKVKAAIYLAQVGRVPLYLLTTNLKENRIEDRILTDQLYGGDREMRIRQEILLGIGGVIALRALEIKPTVFHMNEGHSAFLALERIKGLMQRFQLEYGAAFEAARSSMVFTTHTPVPAGNDVFTEDLVSKYLKPMSDELTIGWEPFMQLGMEPDGAAGRSYTMPVVALRSSSFANGVSRLHAHVARGMWQSIWPNVPEDEVPINPITNGVHIYSWTSHDLSELFDRYLGPNWRDDPLAPDLWHRVYEIPDEELWRTHERRRARLVAFSRRRLEIQLAARGASPDEIKSAAEVLNPEALTIGFARRFATYKRAYLLFRDPERLKLLVSSRQRPVQFLFAGKAHPRDDEGKKVIRNMIHTARDEALRYRIVFLEDYDMMIARYMVQGADVWFNTPRRPLEASGTSGMKAVANGALHLSCLDGWWDQAYHADYGWAIGSGEEYDDYEYQDQVEGSALYDLLEREVVPLFYRRTIAELPREWVTRMKRSIASLMPRFASHRMVRNYLDEAYIPSKDRYQQLAADGYANARTLAGWRVHAEQHWDGVHVVNIEVDKQGELVVGDKIQVRVSINPGVLTAQDLRVEAYAGTVDSQEHLRHASAEVMELDPDSDTSQPSFIATLTAPQSGSFGFAVRLMPYHSSLPHRFALYRVLWASGS